MQHRYRSAANADRSGAAADRRAGLLRRSGGVIVPAVGHEVSCSVRGGDVRDGGQFARCGGIPLGIGDWDHERPGRKVPGRREHRPYQCLGLPDDLGGARDHRQHKRPCSELAGEMLELADLPSANRRPSRERKDGTAAQFGPRLRRRDHQPPE